MPEPEQTLPPCGCQDNRLCSYHEGAQDERERINDLLHASAEESKELWEATRDGKREHAISEYWRGQMNGLHHMIGDINGR